MCAFDMCFLCDVCRPFSRIVESEARYVGKLALLDRFRREVQRAGALDKRQLSTLFANIASLHAFHEEHLLPQLVCEFVSYHRRECRRFAFVKYAESNTNAKKKKSAKIREPLACQ